MFFYQPELLDGTHFNATATRMLEKNVLRLEIAVNDVQPKESAKALQNRVGHLADKWRAEAAKLPALQQVVQVDAKQFEGDADVRSEDKVFQHVNHVQLVFSVLCYI